MKVKFRYNPKKEPWGRCGGGWSYVFSIQGSKRETCINLTWWTIRIKWY